MTPEVGTHIATIKPDERGRLGLRKWLHRGTEEWRVFVEDDGKTIILQGVEK